MMITAILAVGCAVGWGWVAWRVIKGKGATK